jgi:uncharacterized protein DUF4198
MLRHTLLFSLLFAISLTPVLAHDIWLMPEKDSSDPKAVLIRAVMGSNFPKGEETKKASDYQNARFQQKGASEPLPEFSKEAKLLGRVSGGEAFFVSALGPTREIDLKPEEARKYLSEEVGLEAEAIDKLMENAGHKLHETYSRTLKSLVVPPTASFIPLDVPLGWPLEIHLFRYERAGDGRKSFAFRVSKDAKPLAGASVRVVGPDGKTIKTRTDERGEAEASIIKSGPILIAFIEFTSSKPGRYETRWTNLALFDLR